MIKHIMTGIDNKTYDVSRVIGALSAIAAIALQSYVTLNTGIFDVQAFSIGMATLLAGVGVSVRVKAITEPEC